MGLSTSKRVQGDEGRLRPEAHGNVMLGPTKHAPQHITKSVSAYAACGRSGETGASGIEPGSGRGIIAEM